MKFKPLSKREKSVAEKIVDRHILYIKMASRELYYNLGGFES